MGKNDRRNRRFIKKYNPKVLPFKKLPRTHQLAIAYYMAIDGEAWELLGVLGERHSEYRPSDRSYGKNVQKLQDDFEKYRKALKKLLGQSLHHYIKKYGDKKFGMVDIPTKDLIQEIMKRNRDIKEDWETFEEYKKWYLSSFGKGYVGKHISRNRSYRWPSIISGFDDEVLEDGWTRFHCYVARGDKTIPCIFYVWKVNHFPRKV